LVQIILGKTLIDRSAKIKFEFESLTPQKRIQEIHATSGGLTI
jgi:hypothetical protein